MKKKSVKKPRRTPTTTARKTPVPPNRLGFWRENWVAGLLLLLFPFVLYGVSLAYGYVLDDKIVLSENNFVKAGLAGIGDIFARESFSGYLGAQSDLVAGARYRPLSLAMFAVEYELFGLNPVVGHLLNILLYAFTGLLIFRLIALAYPERGPQKRWYTGVAFLTAALFIAHPVHTEVVANIKGRDEILTLLLSLGSLFYAFRFVQKGGLWYPVMSGVLFFLGLLAKENALTFLAVIPVSLYLFTEAKPRRIGMAVIPLLAAAVLYLSIRVGVIGYLLDSGTEITGIMNNPFAGTTWAEKYATISYTLGKYLGLLIFPHPLTHDYYPYQVPIVNWADWRALLPLILHLGLIALAVRFFRKVPVVSWSILYYVATLSIVSNLVFPVGAPMNERFLYMPSLGFVFALAWLLRRKVPKWLPGQRGDYLSWALLGLLFLGYSVKAITRVPAWTDEMTLNRAAVAVSTNSARANSYMAYSLYRLGLTVSDPAEQKRIFDEATPYVDRALVIYPEYSDALTCKSGLLAGYYQLDGDLDKLLAGFYRVLAARYVDFLGSYLEYLNRANADRQKMIDFYHRAGYELLSRQKRNYGLAVRMINYGLSLDANNLPLIRDLTATYLAAGDYGSAVVTAQRGLRIAPTDPELRDYLQEASRRQ